MPDKVPQNARERTNMIPITAIEPGLAPDPGSAAIIVDQAVWSQAYGQPSRRHVPASATSSAPGTMRLLALERLPKQPRGVERMASLGFTVAMWLVTAAAVGVVVFAGYDAWSQVVSLSWLRGVACAVSVGVLAGVWLLFRGRPGLRLSFLGLLAACSVGWLAQRNHLPHWSGRNPTGAMPQDAPTSSFKPAISTKPHD
jgi:hypothetical protein